MYESLKYEICQVRESLISAPSISETVTEFERGIFEPLSKMDQSFTELSGEEQLFKAIGENLDTLEEHYQNVTGEEQLFKAIGN